MAGLEQNQQNRGSSVESSKALASSNLQETAKSNTSQTAAAETAVGKAKFLEAMGQVTKNLDIKEALISLSKDFAQNPDKRGTSFGDSLKLDF